MLVGSRFNMNFMLLTLSLMCTYILKVLYGLSNIQRGNKYQIAEKTRTLARALRSCQITNFPKISTLQDLAQYEYHALNILPHMRIQTHTWRDKQSNEVLHALSNTQIENKYSNYREVAQTHNILPNQALIPC